MRKIDQAKVSKLSQQLGLFTENDVLIFAEGDDVTEGGLILLGKGLDEIRKSLEEEEN